MKGTGNSGTSVVPYQSFIFISVYRYVLLVSVISYLLVLKLQYHMVLIILILKAEAKVT